MSAPLFCDTCHEEAGHAPDCIWIELLALRVIEAAARTLVTHTSFVQAHPTVTDLLRKDLAAVDSARKARGE